MKRRGALAALLALSLAVTGCTAVMIAAGAAAGAGAIVWYRGWLRETIAEPVGRVHRAARAALGDFKVDIVEDSLDDRSGVVDGYLEDGRRVMVKARRLDEKKTRVRVRVGFWGDQTYSLRILARMKKHL